MTIITGSETLRTRFCQQPFRTQGPGRDTAYAKLVGNAVLRSWQWQCVNWNLGTPPDANSVHDIVINDVVHWYHGPADTNPYSSPGPDRVIRFPNDIRWNHFHYTNEDSAIRVAIAHEFYHGIQWGLSQDKWLDSTWCWFFDAQAMFLPSVEHESEEFDTATHFFPLSADHYLTTRLNHTLTDSGDYYCLFWRFMYERFLKDTFPQPKTALQFARDCYAESVGTGSSIIEGKGAIDRAMTQYYTAHGLSVPDTFAGFDEALREYALYCCLDSLPFSLWSPTGVYARPYLTLEDTFRLPPNRSDSIKKSDTIPHSFGIDLLQVALNGFVDTLTVTRTFIGSHDNMFTRLVKVYPNGSYAVDTLKEVGGGSAPPKTTVVTEGADRVCLIVTRHDAADNTPSPYEATFTVKNAWGEAALVPEAVRNGGALAAVGDTLIYAFPGNRSRSFYCYDPRRDTWVQKQSTQFDIDQGAALTWDGGEWLYALRGCSISVVTSAASYDTVHHYHHELLKYNITDDAWDLESDCPPCSLGPNSDMVYGGNGRLYVLQGGYDSLEQTTTLLYDTLDGSWNYWTPLHDTSTNGSLGWVPGGDVYLVVGSNMTKFCRYDGSLKDWVTLAPLSSPAGVAPDEYSALAHSTADDRLYCAWGATHFEKYDMLSNVWTQCAPLPAVPPDEFDDGGALASCCGYVYCLIGDLSPRFWRYTPVLSPGGARLAAAVDESSGPLGTTASRLDVLPNPVRGAAHLRWQVKEPGVVAVRVFDNTGRVVRTIQNGPQPAGRYSARWDGTCDNGRRAACGVFFCRMDAPGFSKIVKLATVGR